MPSRIAIDFKYLRLCRNGQRTDNQNFGDPPENLDKRPESLEKMHCSV